MTTRFAAFLATALWFALHAGNARAETSFEQPHLLPISEVLPLERQSGSGYAIGNSAFADGFAQHFVIETTEFGDFAPSSNYMLEVRVLEIGALEQLATIRKSKAYAKAVAKAGIAPVYVLKDLVTRPVSTVTGIPKGIWRAGTKAVRWIGGDRRERADTENSATRELIGFSGRKRALAAELGIDPYSSNLKLQDELDRVAWSSFAGGLTVSLAFAAAGLPPAAALTYRVANLTKRTNELATSVSGGELHRRNRMSLHELGMGVEETEAFLNNEYLSPSQKTAITLSLERLRGVAGAERVVSIGTSVKQEAEGIRLQQTMELASAYHQRGAALASLEPAGSDWILKEHSGAVLAMLPADRLLWTLESRELANALKAASGVGSPPAIWVSGVFSQTARTALSEAGLILHERAGDRLEARRERSDGVKTSFSGFRSVSHELAGRRDPRGTTSSVALSSL